MTIPLPELDDLTYATLLDETRAALPAIYPRWTDHNPTDPGVTLIELFAWLTEMTVYRTGRIPVQSERTFLRLLSGGAHGDESDLDTAIAATLSELRAPYRAVTPIDYETLMVTTWPTSADALALESATAGSSRITRVRCLPERDLTAEDKLASAPGHVSLVVVQGSLDDPFAAAPAGLLDAVSAFIHARRLIATQFHAVDPTSVPMTLTATVGLADDAPSGGESVREAIKQAIVDHFHPRTGGPSQTGWPFGRYVDLADVAAVIDDVDGVDFVDTSADIFVLSAPDDQLGTRNDVSEGQVLGLRIEPHELPSFDPDNITITLQERRGGVWTTIE